MVQGRAGKIKKVTEDCQEDIRPLSRHVKEREAGDAKNPTGDHKTHKSVHKSDLKTVHKSLAKIKVQKRQVRNLRKKSLINFQYL